MKRQNQPIRARVRKAEELISHGYIISRVGENGTRKGLIKLSKVVFHRFLTPQSDTEGRMAKVLPDHVCRSAGAGVEERAVEEGRPPGLANEEGQPLACLTAGCGTEAGYNFLRQPCLGGWAGSASLGVNAGLSLEILTTSWRVPTWSLKDDL